MKQEPNKEIDLLLRRMAARADTGLSAESNTTFDEGHMDADEMSLFAENVLTPAARSRYTAHLADCSRCRQIVAGLSASLGAALVHEKVEPVTQSSVLKKILAALLSPMALRYAAPALAIVLAVGIGYVVLRQRANKAQEYVAENVKQNPATPAAGSSAGQYSDSRESAKQSATPNGTNQNDAEKADSDTQARKEGVPTRTVAPAEAPAVEKGAEPPPPPKAAAAETEAAKRPDDSVATARPVSVGQVQQQADDVSPRGRDVSRSREDDSRRQEQRSYDGAANTVSGPNRAQDKVADSPSKSEQAASGARAPAAKRGAPSEAKKKDEVEMHTVSGRRFHREDNRWVDTAYTPGNATTNITRGSEQYRALIADEPEIRTIAETLSGEVIVLWKGRAYRIR